MRHCTKMKVEKNYVDSHGQSEGAFAFSHLLGFNLIVSKSIVKYRQTEFPFRNSLHFYFERLILLG